MRGLQSWRRLLKSVSRTSLVVLPLRVHAPNAGRPGSIPDQKTRSSMLQLKIPQAATKTQHSQFFFLHFSLRIFLTLLPEYWPLPESEFLSASIWEHFQPGSNVDRIFSISNTMSCLFTLQYDFFAHVKVEHNSHLIL